MFKKVFVFCLVLVLAITGLSVPSFAWEGDDWLQAYWSGLKTNGGTAGNNM